MCSDCCHYAKWTVCKKTNHEVTKMNCLCSRGEREGCADGIYMYILHLLWEKFHQHVTLMWRRAYFQYLNPGVAQPAPGWLLRHAWNDWWILAWHWLTIVDRWQWILPWAAGNLRHPCWQGWRGRSEVWCWDCSASPGKQEEGWIFPVYKHAKITKVHVPG